MFPEQVPKKQMFGQIRSSSQGTGIILLQLETQVNVEYPFLMEPRPQKNFYDIEIYKTFTGKNDTAFEPNVCVT